MIKKFKNKLIALKEMLKNENKIHEITSLNFKKEEHRKKELNALETK